MWNKLAYAKMKKILRFLYMSENIELKPYDEEIFIHGKENIDENEIQNQNK